jgi:tetratricopeptide (TPR) repeat protein
MERPLQFVLFILPAAALVAAGCDGQLSPQAAKLLEAGKADYRAREFSAAVEKMDRFLEENSRSDRAGEACYYRGLSRREMGDLDAAAADFEAALERAESAKVRIGALVARGDIAYERSNMPAAEEMYRGALEEIERGQKPEDHARYRLGCALQRQGQWRQADVEFDRVIFLFGDSELARRSAARVRSLAWTVQAGAYVSRELAARAAADLKRAGLPADVHSELREGKPMFLVNVGRYGTYEQARAALGEVLRRREDAFVTTTR